MSIGTSESVGSSSTKPREEIKNNKAAEKQSVDELIKKLREETLAEGLRTEDSQEGFEYNAKVLFKKRCFGRADGCFQNAADCIGKDKSKVPYYLFMRALCNCLTPRNYPQAIELLDSLSKDYLGKNEWAFRGASVRAAITDNDPDKIRALVLSIGPEIWEKG